MKFHWFAEVTYPHLPADFPQKHKSAWVDPPVSLMDPTKVGEMYRMFLRLMEQADREGFDGRIQAHFVHALRDVNRRLRLAVGRRAAHVDDRSRGGSL